MLVGIGSGCVPPVPSDIVDYIGMQYVFKRPDNLVWSFAMHTSRLLHPAVFLVFLATIGANIAIIPAFAAHLKNGGHLDGSQQGPFSEGQPGRAMLENDDVFSKEKTSNTTRTTQVITPTTSSTGTPASISPTISTNASLSTASAIKVATADSGIWNYKNSLFADIFVSTGIPPAVVNHNGQLVVMYTDKTSGDLYFARGNNNNFGSGQIKVVDANGAAFGGIQHTNPALASLDGTLHAVIQQQGNLVHITLNDTTNVWTQESLITSLYSTPTLAVYGGGLFLGVVSNSGNGLSFAIWNTVWGWSTITSANGETTWGIPGMYVLEDVLYMVFAANNDDRGIINLVYDLVDGSWSRASAQLPAESTAYGVSATYDDSVSFIGFQDHRDDHTIFVSQNDGTWIPHETPGGSSANTPSMAILDGVLNVVFDSNNNNRDILWLQRQLTTYTLDSWMSAVDSSEYVSSLSIPGTHDSASMSYAPTVGCQWMTITEQLDAGIRYLDLRAGVNNNVLIMYHNFYPINFPSKLYFTNVIEEITTWLQAHESEAVFVQIKEDHDPVSSTITFAYAVSQVTNSDPNSWNLGTTIPTLGEVRGQMQLLRRYTVNPAAGEQAIGFDLTNWPDNSPHFDIFTPSGAHFILQDEYQFDEDLPQLVDDKFTAFNNLLQLAINDPNQMNWYINFASATHLFDSRGAWIQPEYIAAGYNDLVTFPFPFVPGMNDRLRTQIYGLATGRRLGTILMDFPEEPNEDLIGRIVAENMV